ncbi:protealysin inhibitor emfourin [Pseudomonas sp. Marseille-QA0892]
MTASLPLEGVSCIQLSLEGGVAFLPGRRNSCAIELDQCPPTERERLQHALQTALQRQQAEEDAGRGDQRYFVVLVSFRQETQAGEMRFKVPEQQVPDALIAEWRRATGRR